ncbi:MAG: hypothetical protein ACI30K_08215 [Muribaculaceae bacterium]
MDKLFSVLGTIVIIGAISRFIEWLRERRDRKEIERQQFRQETMKENVHNVEALKPDTRGLMFNALSEIGCQPIANDDGTLSVHYQGEIFNMEFGGLYARVWDYLWSGVRVNDPDLPNIREAVNATNYNFGPTVVMSAPNNDGIIGFHTRYDIMLHPACPVNVQYVKAVLDSFFDAKRQVRCNFDHINAQQVEARANRQPVGFNTTNQE